MAHFGICIGNSSMFIASASKTGVEICVDSLGLRSLPAYICSQEGTLIGGQEAKNLFFRQPTNCLYNLMRLDESAGSPDYCSLTTETEKDEVFYTLAEKKYSRVKLFGGLFEKLGECANQVAGDGAKNAVIAAPVDSPVLADLVEAAENSGFTVLGCVNNHAAALEHYSPRLENGSVLVVQMGDSAVTISQCVYISGFFETKQVDVIEMGSRDLTKIIQQLMLDDIIAKQHRSFEVTRRMKLKLFRQAEEGKHLLSKAQQCSLYVESLLDGADYKYTLSLAKLIHKARPLVSEIEKKLQSIVAAGFTTEQICLTGGGWYLSFLQDVVRGVFPMAPLHVSQSPDEAIALGAAQFCMALGKRSLDCDVLETTMAVPCLSCDISGQVEGGDSITLYKAGQPLPLQTPLSQGTGMLVISAGDEVLSSLQLTEATTCFRVSELGQFSIH